MPSRAFAAKRRQIETGLTAHVGGERADAARVGYHRDAGHVGLGVWARRCHLQEFVVILDSYHPVLGKDRIVPGIGARQRCSMRACRPGSRPILMSTIGLPRSAASFAT